MTEHPLNVALGARGYDIHIGEGLLSEASLWNALTGGRDILVVTNETIAPLWLPPLSKVLASSRLSEIVLPDGEAFKTLDTLGAIYDRLLTDRFGRDGLVLALGGGVVGDMAGFAAATYQRGIDFIQVPTTLLAQVDSSVGGKTGVNHPLGKNMIGAFHQPRAVIIDTKTLATLPERELRAGIAEVIKYGVLGDRDLFEWLENNIDRLMAREADALAHVIRQSCVNKAKIVAEDEREGGRRALLNLGHTFGHAIEAAQGYGCWLHGEAVAVGMCMAVDLSVRLGWVTPDVQQRTQALIAAAGLPVAPPPEITPERFMDLMSRDKKVQAGRLRLVLLRGLGQALVTDQFDPAALAQTLAHYAHPEPAAPP